MLLEARNAIVYGGGGQVGGAIARAFAGAGARVHLVGRTESPLAGLAAEIAAAGGSAEYAVFDALDETAINRHAGAVVARHGSLDISVNVITHGDVQGTPLVEMSLADFERPVLTAVRTTFLTATAAARHMIEQGSGVILAFGGDGPPPRNYNLGGLQVAFASIEMLRRNLAAELGRHGIRVITLRTGGIAEALPPDMPEAQSIADGIVGQTMLGRAATFEDVGNVAVFAASDLAKSITATAINISCGTMVD